MSNFIISSYFEDDYGPIVGLTPTVKIWAITPADEEMIVGFPHGTGQNTDGVMIGMGTFASPTIGGDGFYKFVFSDDIGYDPTKTYIIQVDGGPSVSNHVRYQAETITPLHVVSNQDVANAVWNTPRIDCNELGTFGEAVNQTKADLTAIRVTDIPALLSLMDLVRKYDTNRTKIDPPTRTLTIYDDDGTTVLKRFQLLDSTSTPSVVDVCERMPTN